MTQAIATTVPDTSALETTTASAAPVAPEASAPVATATPAFSITALVLGIVGIVAGQWWLAVVAIVFGFVARSREPQARLMANWGLVLGFVGAFGWLVVGVLGLAFAAPFLAFAPFWS